MTQTPFESIISWVRKGYPEGIDPTEFPPLLALLTRVLDETQVTQVALTLAREHGADTYEDRAGQCEPESCGERAGHTRRGGQHEQRGQETDPDAGQQRKTDACGERCGGARRRYPQAS